MFYQTCTARKAVEIIPSVTEWCRLPLRDISPFHSVAAGGDGSG